MEEDKIYIVCEYSDYCDDYPIKAFFNKDKAELFKKEKEEELKTLKERYHNKCCNCAWGDKYCELYEKPIDKEQIRIYWYGRDIKGKDYWFIFLRKEK